MTIRIRDESPTGHDSVASVIAFCPLRLTSPIIDAPRPAGSILFHPAFQATT